MEKEQLFENILKENVELDDAFSRFREAFLDNMKSYIDEETIDNILSSVSGRWALRSYRDYYVVLNVKGKGWGNFDLYNKDNRAASWKLASAGYESIMQHHQDDFYQEWNETFKEEFGVDVYVLGRSGGWWGFKEDDFLDELTVDNDKLREVFDSRYATLFAGTEDSDDEEDVAVEVLEDDSVNLAEIIKIDPEFKSYMEDFAASVDKTSDYWESEEFNDEQYKADFLLN